MPEPWRVECHSEYHAEKASLVDASIPVQAVPGPVANLKSDFTMKMKVYSAKPRREPKPTKSTIQNVSIYGVNGFDHIRHRDMDVSLASVADHFLSVKRCGMPGINRRHPFPALKK